MTNRAMVDETAAAILAGAERGADLGMLARQVAAWAADDRSALVAAILADGSARRWLRADLLPRLSPKEAADLARRLLAWREDFAIDRRDRSAMTVIRHIPLAQLHDEAPWLAGSNAAASLWRRLVYEDQAHVVEVARRVMRDGSAVARETTLHLLLLDPYHPVHLQGEDRLALLLLALADADGEVRGLAADVLADEAPEYLLPELARWQQDANERVRTAAWDAAFGHDPERASQDAVALLTDDTAPLDARRSALLALGTASRTGDIAPLLATMVGDPDPVLAGDAANLLWTRHRNPLVAEAAARSPHPAVREIGERLLHPDFGSPAAGGSRPDAPVDHADIYDQMLRRLRDEPERD